MEDGALLQGAQDGVTPADGGFLDVAGFALLLVEDLDLLDADKLS
jgi:hypothetical protein